MRVCIDLTSLDDNFSGIERYAACLSSEMINDESNDYILVFKNKVHSMFKEPRENVKTIIIPGCRKLWFNQVRLPLVLNRIKADYYLFLAFPVPIFLYKKNMVSTIHDICCWDCPETMNGLSKWYFRISHRVALKKCRAIITISEFSKKRIIDRLKYDPNNIWVIYCGVDKKFLDYKKIGEKAGFVRKKYNLPDRYILSLSTLEPRKNLGLLIEAYTELLLENNFNIPLVLAGRKGWKMDDILSNIDLKVHENILFTGFIDDEDLPIVYANAQFFVFPSLYEGFGMPPLEALACGTRVLSSNSSSMPEILGSRVSYFENNNIESLKSELLTLFNDNCSSKSDKLASVELFDWNHEGNNLLKKLY